MDYKEIISKYTQLQGHKTLQLRAVLFDMDGVLFDSMPFHAKAWSQVMTDAGFKFSEEDVYMNEGRTGADTINTASLAQFGKPSTAEQIDELCKAKCALFGRALLTFVTNTAYLPGNPCGNQSTHAVYEVTPLTVSPSICSAVGWQNSTVMRLPVITSIDFVYFTCSPVKILGKCISVASLPDVCHTQQVRLPDPRA